MSIPVTLIDNKNAVAIANNITFEKVKDFFLISFSKILKLINVQIIQVDMNGISLGLNNELPNKYG